MKPERIQIFLRLVEGSKTFINTLWKVVTWLGAAVRRLICGCPGDHD